MCSNYDMLVADGSSYRITSEILCNWKLGQCCVHCSPSKNILHCANISLVRMQLRSHWHTTSKAFQALKGLFGMLQVRKNEISLRNWSGGTAKLRNWEGTLTTCVAVTLAGPLQVSKDGQSKKGKTKQATLISDFHAHGSRSSLRPIRLARN